MRFTYNRSCVGASEPSGFPSEMAGCTGAALPGVCPAPGLCMRGVVAGADFEERVGARVPGTGVPVIEDYDDEPDGCYMDPSAGAAQRIKEELARILSN